MIHIPSWSAFWVIDCSCTHINLKSESALVDSGFPVLLNLSSEASSLTLHWMRLPLACVVVRGTHSANSRPHNGARGKRVWREVDRCLLPGAPLAASSS